MNNIMYPKKKRAFKGYEFCIQYFILKIFMTLNLVTAYKFAFNFYKNENSEILFFLQRQENRENSEHNIEKFDLKSYNTNEENQFDRQDPVFTYTKENFIEFYLLNNMLFTNSFENNCQNRIINCNFDLSYCLKLSKDFTVIPNRLTICQLKYFLLTLKFLQAVDNKNMAKLLQALIFKVFICSNTDKNNTKHEEIIDSNFMSQFDFYIKRGLLIAFLNILMINYTFYDENLILLEKSKDIYYTSHFNEHIPYKNLLINNYKIFRTLKNTLKGLPNFLCIFQILLDEINIKSLIINNYEELENHIEDVYLFISSLTFFKSIVVLNSKNNSRGFLYDPNSINKKDIEYLSLKNLTIELSNLVFLLEQQKLKGLILNCIDIEGVVDNSVESNMKLNLEYIHLINVKMKVFKWCDFFKSANVHKIILNFSGTKIQESILNELIHDNSCKDVLYLEISFGSTGIWSNLHVLLKNFIYLHTFKLESYVSDENIALSLVKTVDNMKGLENLTINLPQKGMAEYAFIFKMPSIKFLCVSVGRSVYASRGKISININFLGNYKSLNEFVLMNAKIDESEFAEIFKLEALTKLSFFSCDLDYISNYSTRDFFPQNITSLDIVRSNLTFFKNFDILSIFTRLENLNIAKCDLESGFLAKLNPLCNFSLKKLHYLENCLDKNDLDRIQNLKCLEELYLKDSKFYQCSFSELGNDCKFLNSLKVLDIQYVQIYLEDLIYLKRFKILKDLKLTLSTSDFFTTINFLRSLPIYILSLDNFEKGNLDRYRYSYSYECYFYEENIKNSNIVLTYLSG
ncbi:hypothetical protein CWI38_0980p0030 [Hamiltosporidium tvaerminnensis]|uniref:Uncharacterized protein n=1 Tax=Hamiltosporidium tvaerminnensis TaxID=1176355 RepID=A0A4Q9LWB7_9MICR|nr:hypothetical protein CWI38_0980p0030 [Hamiltosporidium tvaerminnensis]